MSCLSSSGTNNSASLPGYSRMQRETLAINLTRSIPPTIMATDKAPPIPCPHRHTQHEITGSNLYSKDPVLTGKVTHIIM